MSNVLIQAARILRRHWLAPLLGAITLAAIWLGVIHLGIQMDGFRARGLTPSGQKIYVVKQRRTDISKRSGLSPSAVEALRGVGGTRQDVHRLATTELMRFNVSSGTSVAAARIGAADPNALRWMGVKILAGSLWPENDSGLVAVISKVLATEWFGQAALAVGRTIQIQGRAFTIHGVFSEPVVGFEEVGVWTNQIDDMESLFNNEMRLSFPVFALIQRPDALRRQALQQELESAQRILRENEGQIYDQVTLEAEALSDYLMEHTIRLRRSILFTAAFSVLSAFISYWLMLGVRNLKLSRDNRIRLFLGLDRRSIYWEGLCEQVLVVVVAIALASIWLPNQGLSRLTWPWVFAIAALPILNFIMSIFCNWLILNTPSSKPIRLEPLVACHAAAIMALWLVVGMFYLDLIDARKQSQNISANTYSTLLTMPNGATAESIRLFTRRLQQRIQLQFPDAKLGISTWLPFLDNSSYDYLRRAKEPPIDGVADPRAVDFLDCNPGFIEAFRPRVIAGRIPSESDRNLNWIVLDRRASDLHFANPAQAIGEQVILLRGVFQIAAVVEPLPFRMGDVQRLPQVFLNHQAEQALFPYVALTLELPNAPAASGYILKEEIARLDPRVASPSVETLHKAIERAVQPNLMLIRWIGALVAGLAIILVVAVSSLAQAVIEFRRTDFGTMVALGASQWRVIRFGFSRLGIFCGMGLVLGAWAGFLSCLQFADQIRLDLPSLAFGGLQAFFAVLLVSSISIFVPMLRLVSGPIAPFLREQSGSSRLPVAR